jgi:acyl-CoA thioester hydrolase
VTEVRAGSFALAYEVRDDERVYARASSVIVAYDLDKAGARRLGEDEIAFLKTYQ